MESHSHTIDEQVIQEGLFNIYLAQSPRGPVDREAQGGIRVRTFFTIPVEQPQTYLDSPEFCMACSRLGRYDRYSTARCHNHIPSTSQGAGPAIIDHIPQETATIGTKLENHYNISPHAMGEEHNVLGQNVRLPDANDKPKDFGNNFQSTRNMPTPESTVASHGTFNDLSASIWEGSSLRQLNNSSFISSNIDTNNAKVSKLKVSTTVTERTVKGVPQKQEFPESSKCPCLSLQHGSKNYFHFPLAETVFETVQKPRGSEIHTFWGESNVATKAEKETASIYREYPNNETIVPSVKTSVFSTRIVNKNTRGKINYRNIEDTTQHTAESPATTKSITFDVSLMEVNEILENAPHSTNFSADNRENDILDLQDSLITVKGNKSKSSFNLLSTANNNMQMSDIFRIIEKIIHSQQPPSAFLDIVRSIAAQHSSEKSTSSSDIFGEVSDINTTPTSMKNLFYELHALTPVSQEDTLINENLQPLSTEFSVPRSKASNRGRSQSESSKEELPTQTYETTDIPAVRLSQDKKEYSGIIAAQGPEEHIKHDITSTQINEFLKSKDGMLYHSVITLKQLCVEHTAPSIQHLHTSEVPKPHDVSYIMNSDKPYSAGFIRETWQEIVAHKDVSTQTSFTQLSFDNDILQITKVGRTYSVGHSNRLTVSEEKFDPKSYMLSHTNIKHEKLEKIFTLQMNEWPFTFVSMIQVPPPHLTQDGEDINVSYSSTIVEQYLTLMNLVEESSKLIPTCKCCELYTGIIIEQLKNIYMLQTQKLSDEKLSIAPYSLDILEQSIETIEIVERIETLTLKDAFFESKNITLLHTSTILERLEEFYMLQSHQPIEITNFCTPHYVSAIKKVGILLDQKITVHFIKSGTSEYSEPYVPSYLSSTPQKLPDGKLSIAPYSLDILEQSIETIDIVERIETLTLKDTIFESKNITLLHTSIILERLEEFYMLQSHQPIEITNFCTPHYVSAIKQAGVLLDQKITVHFIKSGTSEYSEPLEVLYFRNTYVPSYLSPTPQEIVKVSENPILGVAKPEYKAKTTISSPAVVWHRAWDEAYASEIQRSYKSALLHTSYVVPPYMHTRQELPGGPITYIRHQTTESDQTQVLLEPMEIRSSFDASEDPLMLHRSESSLFAQRPSYETEIRTIESAWRGSEQEQFEDPGRPRHIASRMGGRSRLAPQRQGAQKQSGFKKLFSPVRKIKPGHRANSVKPGNDKIPAALQTAIQRIRASNQ